MVLLNLLVKPIAIFGIDAQVQNTVGAQEYGIYFSLLNFTYLFNLLLDFGISNFNIKYISHYPHLTKKYIGKMIPLRLFLLILYVLITLGLASIFGYTKDQYKILWFLILNQFLISSILFFRSYFAGLLFLKIDIILSVLDKFFLIIIMGYLLYFQTQIKINIQHFVYAQTLTLLLSFLIAIMLIFIKVGFPVFKWNFSFNYAIIKKSFPYALLILLMMIYNRIDSIMLERILPVKSHEAGIYAQAFRLLDAFFMFASLFSGLLFPIFSTMLKKKQNILALLKSSSSLLFSLSIILVVNCFFNSEFLMNLFYKNDIALSSLVFKYLIICFAPLCVILIFGTLLTANGNLAFLNKTSLFAILLNIFLNFILIPKWGALGATITSLTTQSFVSLGYLFFTAKTFKINFVMKKIFMYVGFILSVTFSAYFLNKFVGNYWQISLTFLIGIAYLLLTNMLEWRLMLTVLKAKTR